MKCDDSLKWNEKWYYETLSRQNNKSYFEKYNYILRNKEYDIGISYITLQHIPTKSPDVSSMDYCAFELLKRAFYKRKTTIYGWILENNKRMEILQNDMFWKSQCKLVLKKSYQMKHLKIVFKFL